MQANDVDATAATGLPGLGSVGKAEEKIAATNPSESPKEPPLKKARTDVSTQEEAVLNLGQDGVELTVKVAGDFCGRSVLDPAMMDIWVHKIFPFLGPGHFLFVALVCKQFKENYLGFFSTLKDIPTVEKCIEDDCPCPAVATNTFFSAAFSSVPCTEYWNNTTQRDEDRLVDGNVCPTVAKHGNLDAFKWARHQRFPWTWRTCAEAAKSGHLEILKHAHGNGCEWDSKTCTWAAWKGHLNVLKYALESDCPSNEWTCALAAGGGHLNVLKYALESDCPCNEWTCAEAAGGGHLEILKWERERECPWNDLTCAKAAGGGHLEILKWARENECPWGESTCSCAA